MYGDSVYHPLHGYGTIEVTGEVLTVKFGPNVRWLKRSSIERNKNRNLRCDWVAPRASTSKMKMDPLTLHSQDMGVEPIGEWNGNPVYPMEKVVENGLNREQRDRTKRINKEAVTA